MNGVGKSNGRGEATHLLRGLVRAELPRGVSGEALAERLAEAWAAVVAELGGRAEVVRVAKALDPAWRRPLRPPPNRAEAPGRA